MKLAIVSDLHTEFQKIKNYDSFFPEADVMFFCGDIGVGKEARPLIEEACKRYSKVFYVAGNHEYFNRIVEDLETDWYGIEEELPNLVFAGTTPRVLELENHIILAGTMWTDLSDPEHAAMAEYYMNDYRMIYHVHRDSTRKKYVNGVLRPVRTISPKVTTEWHKQFQTDLIDAISKSHSVGKKLLVATHHSPTSLGLNRKHSGNALDTAYFTSKEMFMDKIALWAFGHTHQPTDLTIKDCKVISNPRGYVINGKAELSVFISKKVWEV